MEGGPGNPPRGIRGVFVEGLRATGKSTLGRKLARAWGWGFIDLDARAAHACGHSTAGEALRAVGEPAWRHAELTALTTLLAQESVIPRLVSLGGGVPCHPPSAEVLQHARGNGWRVLWLHCEVEDLIRRTAASPTDRPSLTALSPAEEIRHLHAVRAPLYAALADARLDVTGTNSAESVNRAAALLRAPPADPK